MRADSNHEHDSAGFFGEHRRIAADDGIHLFARHQLAVLSFVQPLPVDGVGNLFGGHAAVAFNDDIYDGFFNFHDLSVQWFSANKLTKKSTNNGIRKQKAYLHNKYTVGIEERMKGFYYCNGCGNNKKI